MNFTGVPEIDDMLNQMVKQRMSTGASYNDALSFVTSIVNESGIGGYNQMTPQNQQNVLNYIMQSVPGFAQHLSNITQFQPQNQGQQQGYQSPITLPQGTPSYVRYDPQMLYANTAATAAPQYNPFTLNTGYNSQPNPQNSFSYGASNPNPQWSSATAMQQALGFIDKDGNRLDSNGNIIKKPSGPITGTVTGPVTGDYNFSAQPGIPGQPNLGNRPPSHNISYGTSPNNTGSTWGQVPGTGNTGGTGSTGTGNTNPQGNVNWAFNNRFS